METEYEMMLARGRWLESFLTAKESSWEYLEIMRAGVHVLNITYKDIIDLKDMSATVASLQELVLRALTIVKRNSCNWNDNISLLTEHGLVIPRLIRKFTIGDRKIIQQLIIEPTVYGLLHDIAMTMLIEFLHYDGQYYFGFCKHCGKFYVSERQGIKHFCSDKCRSDNYYQENKNATR